MKKRLLSALLTLGMVASMLPMSTLAAETEPDKTVEPGTSISLNVGDQAVLNGSMGNDHSWSIDSSEANVVEFEDNGDGNTAERTITAVAPGMVTVTHVFTPEDANVESSEEVQGQEAEDDSITGNEPAPLSANSDTAQSESFTIVVETESEPDPIMPSVEIPEETCSVDYKEQSEFVTYDGYTGNAKDGYVFNYTIHDGAHSDLVIDLAQGALDLWENESQVPGDHFKFQINITNESSRTYTYRDNSFVLAPKDTSEFGSIEDNSLLPILTYDGQYMPISLSGAMIPKFFYEDVFEVEDDNAVTFEMMCQIYTYLAAKSYIGESAISDYMLDYFNERHSTSYASLSEMFAENPDWLGDDMTYKNGIWTMSKGQLEQYISEYPWIDRFLFVETNGDQVDVQIKWPESELAAVSYNAFYQGLFSVVFGKENAEYLNPNPSGDLEFSRSHAVGDYMLGTDLYEETNTYFQNLTQDGFASGDTLEIWSGYGIDGPGMGNAYQNYTFTYYNVIELQEAEEEPEPDLPIYDFDVTVDKTATQLDENNQTDVTLNVGGNTVTTASDVVFVLDKSASTDIRQEAANMLDELMDRVGEGNTIKVGVVNFEQGVLEQLELTELNDANFETIQGSVIFHEVDSSGTNIYAGLLAGKDMLDADESVADEYKHLVLVTDGVTYLWGDGTENNVFSFYSESVANGEENLYASHETIDWHHSNKGAAYYNEFLDMETWYQDYGDMIQNTMETYQIQYEEGQYTASKYGIDHGQGEDTDWSAIPKFEKENSYIPVEDVASTASASDAALYMTAQIWQEIVEEYNAYSYADPRYQQNGQYEWSYNAISNLGDFGDFSSAIPESADDYDGMFDDVMSHVLYAIDSGTVNDIISSYFDLTDKNGIDENTFTLTVGGIPVTATSVDKAANTVYFGEADGDGQYPYSVTYIPGSSTVPEQFNWQINVPVETGKPVELTYSLTLVSLPVGTGTIQIPTNEEATLEYTTSTDRTGTETFPIPEVTYKVEAPANALVISKTVNNTTDQEILDKSFQFTVTFDAEGSYPYYFANEDTPSGSIASGGSLQLKNGETVSIYGLPIGTRYTVSETADVDFTTTVSNNDGPTLAILYSGDNISASGTIEASGPSLVHYVNTYKSHQISIQPADITIYTGGDGYESVVTGEGEDDTVGTASDGLPEPGFYITLPDDVNAWLLQNAKEEDIVLNEDGQEVVDLSQYLTFTYNFGGQQRTWKLERYDNNADNTSMAFNKFIYRILPAEVYNAETGKTEEIPIRLQFTQGEDFMTSDDFNVSQGELYQNYSMTIYVGDLNQGLVKAELTVNGETNQYSAVVMPGTLSIRGVNEEDPINDVNTGAPASEVGEITAYVPTDTNFYINDSDLEVADPDAVALLVDSIVPDPDNTLYNSAIDKFSEITSSHDYQMQYLDLVDTSNGNAYVTTDQNVDIYWPYPEGTDQNTEFYVVHYEGLDRDVNNELDGTGYVKDMVLFSEDNGALEMTDHGIKFTVNSFSPFALFWEDDNGGSHSGGGGGGSSNDDDDDDDDKPELNKEDHIAYVSGYPDGTVQPEGYITREEVATIFFRLLTDSSRADFITEYNPYPDVEYGRWSYYAITTMTNGDLMLGRPGGVFDPGANITRAEFAVVASLFSNAQYSGPDQFTDISDHWARDYINRAAAEGWVAGYPDCTFGPDRFITRAEVMALVNEVLERAPDADYMLEDMTVWPDNPESAWYYEDVQEATNSHAYVWRNSQHTSEDWEDFIPMRTFDELVRDAFLAS